MRLSLLVTRVACASAIAALPAFSQTVNPHLIPKPREVSGGEFVPVSRTVNVLSGMAADDRFAANDLAASLRERGLRAAAVANAVAGAYRISLLRADAPI